MTELVFILDRSGSMHGLEADTIGGMNSVLDRQKKENTDETLVSTVLFSDSSEVIHDRVPLDQVPDLTDREYRVGGCTALLDAVGGAIQHIGNIHKYARPEDVPGHTMVVIITDGMENASRWYTYDKVKKMIDRQQKKYGWEFVFLGANIDAAREAGRIGIDSRHSAQYLHDARGVEASYDAVCAAVGSVRRGATLEAAHWKDSVAEDVKKRGRRR